MISVTTQPGQLTNRFRIYNGGSETLNITGDDIQLALGYVANPSDPFNPVDAFEIITLLSNQAVDITVI